MKERINWIDWAKTLAVCSVVFCHLPQSQEWFYYRYLQALTMVIFFFISGYLKKDRGSDKANWRKYWYGLIIPYIIYNLAVYPYWLLKSYLANGALPDFFHAMRPLTGALLLEHENAFAEPLNGPLWYLPAILVMHIIIDLCRKTRHQHLIMISLCIVSVILYTANKYWYFAPNLTPIGIMRNLPYYYIGYLFGQHHMFRDCHLWRDFISCALCLIASILFFAWHLDAFYADQHILHIALFYPTNICFLFGVLYLSKLFNTLHLKPVTNISIGTLVIIGLHIVLVTAVNFTLEHLLHINGVICYHWYEALPVAILIIALLYPIILWAKQHLPILIGKNQLIEQQSYEKKNNRNHLEFSTKNSIFAPNKLTMETKLSIIVPVYNVEKYIRPCFESIFKQGLDDSEFEVIIVNDGTKDRSMEMIADIISQHQNIRVINQESQGLSVARNNGIAAAKGEYILMPDSDDLLIENSLTFLLDKAISSKADLIVADFLEMTSEEIDHLQMDTFSQKDGKATEKTGEELLLQDLSPYQCYVWRTLFRKDFLLEECITFTPGVVFQDVPFTHECYIKAEKCLRVSWLLNIYRILRESSATNSFNMKKAKDFCIVIAKTWELTHEKGLSKKALQKLQNDIYVSFQVLNCTIAHSFRESSERYEIIDFLRHKAPDLRFRNGIKQRITTLMYRMTPHTYTQMRFIYANIIEDKLLPFYHHKLRRLFKGK